MAPLPLLISPGTAPHSHLEGTLLPRGFFLGLGLIYLMALALDRLSERLRVPSAIAILLLGLGLHDAMASWQPIRPAEVETAERISLALLIFYAGLGTDLRRIRGRVGAGLRLGTLGVLITLVLLALALQTLAAPLGVGAGPLATAVLPAAAAWLTASCLTATDSSALEDLLEGLGHAIPVRLSRLLSFEAALSTVVTLLCFGFLAGVFQERPHSGHLALHVDVVLSMPSQLLMVARHLLAGALTGLVVGALGPPLIDRLVRSASQLLLVAIALAFVAFGLGQFLGGGGLLAVFAAGVVVSNGHYRLQRFDQHALHGALHPFNSAAEFTVLLLLGLTVVPQELLVVLPLGLVLALLLPLARLAGTWIALPSGAVSGADRLLIVGCGLRGAVPLGLALAAAEELPHLHGLDQAYAEPLAERLLALVFVVVLLNLLLQSGLMNLLSRRLARQRMAEATGSMHP